MEGDQTNMFVSTTTVPDINSCHCGDANIPSSDAFAFRQSGLNEFLFAPVGTEANGMTLSLVSVFARLGNDPWLEAGRLAKLPISEATERRRGASQHADQHLAASCRDGDRRPPDRTAANAVRSVPTGSPASAYGAKAGPFLTIAVALACIACVVAFELGVFRPLDAPAPDGSSVASFAVPPR